MTRLLIVTLLGMTLCGEAIAQQKPPVIISGQTRQLPAPEALLAGNRTTASAGAVKPLASATQTITGAATLGQPGTGYNFELNAANFYSRLINYSGYNHGTSTNVGRTGVSDRVSITENRGNGDVTSYYSNCHIFSPAGRSGATHWLSQPACVGFAGDSSSLVPHTYLQFSEFNFTDQGTDLAAIGQVFNFDRTINTAALGEVWMGDRFQSTGSKSINVGWSAYGLINIGLDTVLSRADAEFNYGKTVALNMAANQYIYWNSQASALNGLNQYGNVLGSAFDTFNSGSGYLGRCVGTGCFNINASNFLGVGSEASGVVTMKVTNSSKSSTAFADIGAAHGTGNTISMRAADTYSLINSSSQTLILGVSNQNALQIDASNNAQFAKTVKLTGITFATLPTCNSTYAGTMAYITDASAAITAWNQTVSAGGGANKAFITCNGTAWKAFNN